MAREELEIVTRHIKTWRPPSNLSIVPLVTFRVNEGNIDAWVCRFPHEAHRVLVGGETEEHVHAILDSLSWELEKLSRGRVVNDLNHGDAT